MEGGNSTKQIALWTALGALFLVPFTPLIVAYPFFFPFITGKAFYFRILIEVAFSAWIVLSLIDKQFRPRISYVSISVVAFVVWMFIADAFAPNAAKAFWSNFERMEGWILLAHLLAFFLVSGAVLRVEKAWRAWFLTSLCVSSVVAAYALLQLSGTYAIHQGSTRIDATFGNSAYMAIYMLFNVFIAIWLALTEKYSWLKWSLIVLAALEVFIIFTTETRGAVIGLVIAGCLAIFLAVVTGSKQVRRIATGGLILLIVLVGSFYLARGSDFVQKNHALQRIASISLSDGQTRFTIWGMALHGVAERPLTGWGQEGFNYIFNKYYDPSLYAQEQWFDRAHNAFIDWLTAGGIPAFLLYISLFGSALLLLWRSSELSRPERIALTAALVGYAVHNMFVFDNLYSYVYFFAILALIDSQTGRPIDSLERLPVLGENDISMCALPVALAVILIWTINFSGMRVATNLIAALSPSQNGIQSNISAFNALVARPAFAKQEIREQLVNFSAAVAQNANVSDADKKTISALALSEMQKQATSYPMDARVRLQLAYAYGAVGDNESALHEIKVAETLSPNKEQILIQLGVAAWNNGDNKTAEESFSKAYALGPQFKELAEYAAAGKIAVGDMQAADAILLSVFGTKIVDSNVLSVAFYKTKNWSRLIDISKLRVSAKGASVEAWFTLAAAYYASGDTTNAIKVIRKAIDLYPEAATAGTSAIAQMEKGA